MNGTYLPPRVLQVVGLLVLVGSVVFWAATGRESVLMVSSAMSLIGLGAYSQVVRSLRDSGRDIPPPPDGSTEKSASESSSGSGS
jgi:hypothetical protein